MARVLIIGGAGFIGSNIARELIESDHEVIIFDPFIQYVSPFETDLHVPLTKRFEGIANKVIVERGDARYVRDVHRVLEKYKPEYVIHLAAMPISTISNVFIGEAIDCTMISTSHLLEAIKDVGGVKRFIYTSSSMVYGDFKYTPVDEEHPKNPKDLYGGAKLAGEVLTQAYGRRFGIDYVIIRPSAVYGPTDMNKRVSQIFVENALKGKELVLEGPDTKLDFTNVKDTAHGFVLAMFSENAKNEVFNITSGDAKSLRELVAVIKEIIPDLKVIEKPFNSAMPERGTLDISKAKRLLGFEPKYNLKEGIKEYIEFLKQHHKS